MNLHATPGLSPVKGRLIHLRRTWAVARKELRHITRNRLTLFLVTLSPALLLFTLANVFTFDVDQTKLAVMDLDRSQDSRRLIAHLTSGGDLSLLTTAGSYDETDRLLVAGTVDAVLIIPPGFTQVLHSRPPAPIQLVVDGGNPIIAGQVIATASGAVAAAGVQLLPILAAPALPFDVRARAWYNTGLDSLFSMVPGLLGIVLSLPALALSLSLTREKELGTLEALMATPIESSAYLAGKTIAYVLTGIVGALLSWLVAVAWFAVPFRGDFWLFVLLTTAYLVATMGFSVFISTWISSQQAAMFTVMLVFFVPSFFLAGLLDPIDPQSPMAVLLSSLLPATHYITIARGLFLKNVGIATLSRPSLILLSMGLLAMITARVIFRKRLA